MKRFLDSLKALGIPRLIGIAGVGLVVLAIVGFVALRGSSQPMALLYGDLELHDSAQVTAALEKLHVAYQLKDNGLTILVPSDQVDRLRLAMASDGLPSGGSVGYEIFDRGDSLTSNQFQQQMNQLRALEGELGRTIRTIRGVRNARVHLVLAKREPFAREQQDAKASIILAMAGPKRMSPEEVQAVVNLVSAAVPSLKAQNISVVDNRGTLLASAGRPGTNGGRSALDDTRRAMELQLDQSVEAMLERTFGPEHVRAEATIEMDFDRVNETQERFDPDKQVVRRVQTVSDANKSTEPQASVSVQNNLPNPDSQSGKSNGTSGSHQEENTTYEIDKTVRTLIHETPLIKKLSMAVLVDGVTAMSAEGKPVWRELTNVELDRVAALVKSAVGFDAKRGDHVEVVNMRFSPVEDLGEPVAKGGWLDFGKEDRLWLITIGVIALVALFSLGFVVRPLALKLATGLMAVPPSPATTALAGPADGETALLTDGSIPVTNLLLAGGQGVDPDKDTMLNVANIQGEIRASSIRNLGKQVESQPDATVMVMRGWLGGKTA